MKKYKVGVVGATGMVGQRFLSLLENHPWFDVTALAASPRSATKTYKEAVDKRWVMKTSIPKNIQDMQVFNAERDLKKIVSLVDFVFCATNMEENKIKQLEEDYAKAECPVISNNSVHRLTQDVPMIIPEINSEHAQIILSQRKRLGTKRGFIAVKSNCSLQSYVPAIHPLMHLGVKNVLACTYQSISGAGKTFETWPEMNDNLIPFIKGEEEKSELEPMKIWGKIESNKIINATRPNVTSQCLRVPISNGHTAAVFVSFIKKVELQEIISLWDNYQGLPQKLNLPSAPKQFIHYFREECRPQISLDRNIEKGMAISVGRLREDVQYDIKFVSMSHNTIRGAAGGSILMAELLCAQGYI